MMIHENDEFDFHLSSTTVDGIMVQPRSQTGVVNNVASGDVARTLTWFVCVYPVANVNDPTGPKAIITALEDILLVLHKLDNFTEFHVAFHKAPPRDHSFGGIRHLQWLEENMVVFAYDIYSELCMNLRNIKKIHVIAGGSGAYLALRVINFFVKHAEKYRYDMDGFDNEWADFLDSSEMYKGTNDRSRMFGNLILVCPSLPALRGFSKIFSSFMRPPFYDHTQLEQTFGKTTILVDGEQSPYFQKVDVIGPDVVRMTQIEFQKIPPAPLESVMSDASKTDPVQQHCPFPDISISLDTGFYGLSVIYEATDPKIDIVALHGLNGHAFSTWTTKEGYMWLRDFLPRDIPYARILTYGYDTKPLNASFGIEGLALDFLASLRDKRKGVEHRKLILIGHSLGGMVIKMALITARKNLEYQSMIDYLSGIVFFGTPHQISAATTPALYVAHLAKVVGVRFSRDSIRILERDCEFLFLDARSFERFLMANALPVVSFCETRTTSFGGVFKKGFQVVDRGSVAAHWGKLVTLDANHFEMCKFNSADSYGYHTVCSCIQDLARGSCVIDGRTAHLNDEILRDLRQQLSTFQATATGQHGNFATVQRYLKELEAPKPLWAVLDNLNLTISSLGKLGIASDRVRMTRDDFLCYEDSMSIDFSSSPQDMTYKPNSSMVGKLEQVIKGGGGLVTSSGNELRIYQRGSPGYDTAIVLRFPNGISKVTPYVVEPGTDLELFGLLGILADWKIKFGLKSGGHLSIPKIYPPDGGLLVDMKQFNNIEYNKEKKTIDVGAGVTCGDVYKYLERFATDQAPGIIGGDPTVGVSGWLLGGGYSLLTNRFGLGMDNILGFRVLIPAKGVCDVSGENHPEIFKALKGGAHNFGIVTQFTLKVHDHAKRTNAAASGEFPEDQSQPVKEMLLSAAQNEFPPEVVVVAAFRHDFNLMTGIMKSFVPWSIWLSNDIPVAIFPTLAPFNENRDLSSFFFADSEGARSMSLSEVYEAFALRHLPVSLETLQTEEHFESLKDSSEIHGIPLNVGDLVERKVYSSHQKGDEINRNLLRVYTAGNKTVVVESPPDPRGRMACIMVSGYTRSLLDEAEKCAKELSAYMPENQGTRASFEIWPFHKGAFDGVKRGDCAWPHEEGKVIYPLIGWFEWSGEANDEFWLAKIVNALEELRKVALKEKCMTENLPVYLNIALENTSAKDIYRDHYEWLKGLRGECDPDNVMGLAAGFVIQ